MENIRIKAEKKERENEENMKTKEITQKNENVRIDQNPKKESPNCPNENDNVYGDDDIPELMMTDFSQIKLKRRRNVDAKRQRQKYKERKE